MELNQFKAALFDMDGTLYDSMPRHAKAWLTMLAEKHISATESEILLAEGRTGRDIVRLICEKYQHRHASDEECSAWYERKAELFRSYGQPDLMPGAIELVEAVRRAGLTTVLVTGSAQGSLLGRLANDFPGVFPPERRVTALNVSHGKPLPEPFLRGMEMAGSSPADTIAFDNAPLGVESAHRAGCYTVGIVTGNIPVEALREAGADLTFPSMAACAAYFAR